MFISGGSVKATGKEGDNIGNGWEAGKFELITPKSGPNGEDVQLLEISNTSSSPVKIDSKDYQPVNHGSGNTTLYAYLTKGDHTIQVGGKQHNYKYENGQFVPNGTVSLTNPVTLRIDSDSNEWLVSYDDGDSWNQVVDDEGHPVKATGADGTTPQLKVTDNYWQVSYDGGSKWVDVTDSSGNKVAATGAKGDQGVSITGVEKTGSSGLEDTYTITYSNGKTSTFTVTNGAKGDKGDTGATGPQGPKGETGATGAKGDKGDTGATGATGAAGKDGADGRDGVNGKDGVTPQVKIDDNNEWCVSYDNGKTWTSLGAKATGAKGDTGAAGKDGANGITPQIKTGSDNYWYVSYDNGATWTSMGVKSADAEKAQIASSNVKSLKATAKKGAKVKVTWKAPKGIKKLTYQVRYKAKGAKKWTLAKTTKKTKATVSKLNAGKKYRFQVRGYKKVSGQRAYTDWESTGWVTARK